MVFSALLPFLLRRIYLVSFVVPLSGLAEARNIRRNGLGVNILYQEIIPTVDYVVVDIRYAGRYQGKPKLWQPVTDRTLAYPIKVVKV
jgi:hypothetical protein